MTVSDNGAVHPPEVMATRGLEKSYGGHVVLDQVDFTIAPGEIVAVIGENGAGKSTFAKILAGAVQPDSGELWLKDRRVDFRSPRDALRAGVSYIPQELAYIPNMSVADNILAGRWPSRGGIVNSPGVRSLAASSAKTYGVDIAVHRRMGDLTLAERQLVEILKALVRSAAVLVLDEPTASLTKSESKNLFSVLRRLAGGGLAVIFISHRMDEVFDVSDRVVVLRNGKVAGAVSTGATTPAQLVNFMLGAAARESAVRAGYRAEQDPALQLIGWHWSADPPINDFNLVVNRGEIVCLFGLRGAGGEAIAEGIGGRRPEFNGRLIVGAKEHRVFRTPSAARKAGIGYVPPERKVEGLVMPMSVQANLTLQIFGRFATAGWLRTSRERRVATQERDLMHIQCRSLAQPVWTLSGGNQQKVLLGSRLAAGPSVLVLQEPTRGVDVGARQEIHNYVRSIADQGTPVLWITADVEEAVLIADRLVVLREGAIVAELIAESKTQGRALEAATTDAA